MGITIHYSGRISEKKLNELIAYWKKEVPKIKESFPSKDFFPYHGYKIINRFDKIRDAGRDEDVIDPKKGLTREDMFNHVYAHPSYEYQSDGSQKLTKPKYQKTDYCKGIEIYPHVGSEPVEFIACRQGKEWLIKGFTKTQYGGIPAHLLAGKILETTRQKFLPKMQIHDEAEYFGQKGKHDMALLQKDFEESAIMIDKLRGMLTKAGFKDDQIVTGGEMAIQERKKLHRVV